MTAHAASRSFELAALKKEQEFLDRWTVRLLGIAILVKLGSLLLDRRRDRLSYD